MTAFSNSAALSGIVEQARKKARVDATQWKTEYITNSVNSYLDKIFNYGFSLNKKFNLDDSNHTKLPIGTTNLTSGQSDYAFLTDEQSNRIINVLRIEIGDINLKQIDERDINDITLTNYRKVDGTPVEYDKIADNIIRLYPTPDTTTANGITYYFQRAPSYFTAADTTKEPGLPASLHRGFIVNAAFDIGVSLGLENTNILAQEVATEWQEVVKEFKVRSAGDVANRLEGEMIDSR